MSLNRRARWAVPGAVVAVTAAVIAALQIPAAQAAPDLPGRTPAQLLASLSSGAPGSGVSVPPLTGTVVETASLGLPQLPETGNANSPTSLLTGSHTMKVYYQDGSHFRLAIPQPASETDLIADGSKLWLWQSSSDSVTEFTPTGGKQVMLTPGASPPTPQQAANEILAAVGKTTLVSVQANVMVAGQPCYELVLAPKDSRSLVGRVVIAIDGQYGVPLRVQLYAKGTASPAFQVGFTDLQFVAPSPANFSFTPPPGASVTVEPASEKHGKQDTSGFGTYGTGWLTVAAFPEKDLEQGIGTGAADSAKQQDIVSAGSQGVGVSSQELLNALFGSGKAVHGSWGSGTLVTTSLMSILVTNGEVYVGAVKPSVLEAAVGHTS
jgi:outer membrane lipoprotein-sorting protein